MGHFVMGHPWNVATTHTKDFHVNLSSCTVQCYTWLQHVSTIYNIDRPYIIFFLQGSEIARTREGTKDI